jgi:hypothetical protein
MFGKELTSQELTSIKPGEALSFMAVMAIIAVAVMAVVVYKLLKSSQGGVKMPGGWNFTWE